MRSFEKPIMMISKFETENVVTDASGVISEVTVEKQATQLFNENNINENNVFKFVL